MIPVMSDDPIELSVTRALQASFLQPTGPSRTGIDWSVVIKEGEGEETVIVRTYLDEIPHASTDELAEAAMCYIETLLDSGWTIANYRATPGELTVPPPKNI
jgi:hypothetical protein